MNNELKKAKQQVKNTRIKMKKAKKDLKAATASGTAKQQATCEKRVKMWDYRNKRALVTLKNVKAAQPKLTAKVANRIKQLPGRKIAKGTGATLIVGGVVTAAYLYWKSRGSSDSGEGTASPDRV